MLELDPGTWRSHIHSGYDSLPAARKEALAHVKHGSAKEVSIIRYSQSLLSIRDHVVEIVTAEELK